MLRPSHAVPIVILSALLTGVAPARPRTPPTREVEDQGYRVRLDLGPQVLSVEVPEDWGSDEEAGPIGAPISPTLGGLGDGLVSGSLLAQKAKQFDDGLYAAVELAAQQGAGTFAGKAALLRRRLPDGLGARGAGRGKCRRDRPGRLPAGQGLRTGPGLAARCRRHRGGRVPGRPAPVEAAGLLHLVARPGRHLSPGSDASDRAERWRRDRRLAGALTADPGSRATYDAYLTLVDRLTNPAASRDDLRAALLAIERNRPRDLPQRGVAVFPASRSHEGDLVKKLFGDRPVPRGSPWSTR